VSQKKRKETILFIKYSVLTMFNILSRTVKIVGLLYFISPRI